MSTLAIITLTRQGLSLAKQIRHQYPSAHIYTLPKWADNSTIKLEKKLKEETGELFQKYESLLFIMATGIVVRCIAPYIINKQTDPAVLVADEKGTFIISLLSGHLGGANTLTEEIAQKINAKPVITTASDVNNLPSVDMFAQKHGLEIYSMEEAKNVTALIVDHKLISIKNEHGKINTSIPFSQVSENNAGTIIITNISNLESNKTIAHLIPKNIYIGIGCRRDTAFEALQEFLDEQLQILNINKKAIKQFASAWVKEDEECLLELSRRTGIAITFFSQDAIREVEHQFECSDFVRKTIGVGCVAEPSAMLAANAKGKFLLKKTKKNGITLSIYETEIDL